MRPDLQKPETQQPSGIETTPKQLQASKNCPHKDVPVGKTESVYNTTAPIAEQTLNAFVGQTSEDIAVLRAKQQHGLPAGQTMKSDSVLYAETVLALIGTGQLKRAPKIVDVFIRQTSLVRVYDLTVAQAHSFVANGVWVSNCAEALQYLMLHIANAGEGGQLSQRREIKRASAVGWT